MSVPPDDGPAPDGELEADDLRPGDAAEDAAAAEQLRGEVWRGQDLDRDLAQELGRPAPARAPGADGYVVSLASRPVLPAATERRLVLAAKEGDATARAQLVEAFMPLIAGKARPYRSGQIGRLELLQEGVVGLLRALERYDPERGVPFWPYASWWVRQAMQQLVAELTRPIVLSDRALRHAARVRQAHSQAVQQAGHEPSAAELAERTGLSVTQVEDVIAFERPPRALEEPVNLEDGDVGMFGELLADPLADDEYERVLAAIEVEDLHSLLAGLSPRERTVLRARYGLDGDELSLREVGERLGLSGERVRQIERRALAKLEAAMQP